MSKFRASIDEVLKRNSASPLLGTMKIYVLWSNTSSNQQSLYSKTRKSVHMSNLGQCVTKTPPSGFVEDSYSYLGVYLKLALLFRHVLTINDQKGGGEPLRAFCGVHNGGSPPTVRISDWRQSSRQLSFISRID